MVPSYHILLIILLKEFIKLNANIGMIIKNVKKKNKLNRKILSCTLNIQTLKMTCRYTNVYVVTGITEKSLMNTQRSNLLIHIKSVTIISINLFCFCKELFTHTNAWMIEKNSMKHHYLKKKSFTVT